MEDKWKKMIDENRHAFEQEEPDFQTWENIQSKLNLQSPRMVKLSTVIRYAVAAVMVLSAGAYFMMHGMKSEKVIAHQSEKNKTGFTLSSVSPEYAEMEHYYVMRINATMSTLQSFNPDPEILQAINDLDNERNELQNEMGDQVNQTEIINAMIENYRLKLELLEQMLDAYSENDKPENSVDLKSE